MSKQHRTQMIKSLKEAMEKTTDPEMLLKLSQQAEKLMPKPGKETRGRKPKALDVQNNNLLDARTGSALDSMPEGARIAYRLVLQMEKRGGWNALTRAQKDELLDALTANLSAQERAAIEEWGKDGVV